MDDQPLSPAAQAVLDAAFNVDQPESFDDCVIGDYCPVIAAALRAAANGLSVDDISGPKDQWEHGFFVGVQVAQRGILAIATELENQ